MIFLINIFVSFCFSRVLKPPGGGSSDIFGANNESTTNRNVKHHLASNIFAAPASRNGNGMFSVKIKTIN